MKHRKDKQKNHVVGYLPEDRVGERTGECMGRTGEEMTLLSIPLV